MRVVLACVCGSDLWYYRGESEHAVGSIGHEFIGVVEEVGRRGRRQSIAAISWSRRSSTATCRARTADTDRRSAASAGGTFGNGTIDGGQGEAVRVPLAGSTLVAGPWLADTRLTLALAAHAVRRDVDRSPRRSQRRSCKRGDTVAVVGDGAVGLSAVLASKRLGAERIVALSRHADRQRLAREFGATDIVDDTRRRRHGGGARVDRWRRGRRRARVRRHPAVDRHRCGDRPARARRSGSSVCHTATVPFNETFFRNIGWRGGPCPARIYIPELLDDVLEGRINPGLVFDYETDLDGTPDAYAAMDERRAIKSLITGRLAVSGWTDGRARAVGDATELQLASHGSTAKRCGATPRCGSYVSAMSCTCAPPAARTGPGTATLSPVAPAASGPAALNTM